MISSDMLKVSPVKLYGILIILSILFVSPISMRAHVDLQQDSSENVLVIPMPYSFENQTSQWHVNDAAGAAWMKTISSGLFKRSITDNYLFVPDLASDYPTYSNDNLTLTVKLNTSRRFSNGELITAQDVKFSYTVGLTPAISSNSWKYLDLIQFFESNNSIVVLDDSTIQFTFKTVTPHVFSVLTENIIDLTLFTSQYNNCTNGVPQSCDWSSKDGKYAFGGGPFMLDGEIMNDKIELIKNPYYPTFNQIEADRLIFRTMFLDTENEEQEFYNSFNNGSIDMIPSLYNYQLDLSKLTNPLPVNYNSTNYQELELNHHHPYFGTGTAIPDQGETNNDIIQANFVRKAMSHIINRNQITSDILNNTAFPLATIITPIYTGFNDSLIPREYSVSVARNYMERAGFDFNNIVDSNNDGDYGDPGDTTFFNITILTMNTSLARNLWTPLYADDLAKIGIGVTNFVNEGNEFVGPRTYLYGDSEFVPLYDAGGYDVAFLGGDDSFDLEWTPLYYTPYGGCDTGGCSYFNYNDASVLSKFSDYTSEINPVVRQQMLSLIQQDLYDNLITIPVYSDIDTSYVQQTVEEFDAFAFERGLLQFEHVRKTVWAPRMVNNNEPDSGIDLTNVLVPFTVIFVAAITVYVFKRRRI